MKGAAMAISIGIVGLGQIARKRHVPAIAADADFTLAGLADLGGGEAVVGLPIYTDHHAMLAACTLDAVAICTPPAARFAIARDALLAGKHVLLEKPPAATMGEAEALAREALAGRRSALGNAHPSTQNVYQGLLGLLSAQGKHREARELKARNEGFYTIGSSGHEANAVVAAVTPGDVVVTMGAGDVTLLGPEIISALRARAQARGLL
jgi:hypothetical protein